MICVVMRSAILLLVYSLTQAPEQKHFTFQSSLGHVFLTRETLSASKSLIEQCASLSAVKDTNADIELTQWQSKSIILLQAPSLEEANCLNQAPF